MKEKKQKMPEIRGKKDTEFAGSLTPEMDHPGQSKAHPFRYAGSDRAHNAPRGQLADQ